MIKTDSSIGLPSSKRGIIKKIIIVFITIIISLLTTCTYYFSKNKSVNAHEYTSGNNISIEEFNQKIINNKIEELKEKGYIEITYLEKINKTILLKSENVEDYVLKDYQFYAKYTVLKIDNKKFYFKSSTDADTFIKKIKKYTKTMYKKSNETQEIGKETPQSEIEEIILSKRIIAEKAEAERQAKLKAQVAKKQSQSAAAKNKTASNSNNSKKSTAATKVTITNVNVTGAAIANFAKQFVGNPYVRGGTSLTKGADCSGFAQSIYKHFGINIPRTASQQAKVGKAIAWSDLQPGDLVFYSGNGGKSVTHVAIYIGNGKIVHAQTPQLGIGITTANIMVKMGARRILS